MTGPEHYAEAERLLTSGAAFDLDLAAAQVHATLALAAATAERMASRGPGDIPFHWKEIVHPHDAAAQMGAF